MEKTVQRNARLANIRSGLSCNPALHATTNRLKEKMQRKQRRASIQYGDTNATYPSKEQISDSQDNTTTSLFLQKYSLGEKAGEGAHGVVKKCINKSTGKVFAVKTQTLEREQLLNLKKNFEEVKALKHPNVLSYKSLFFQLNHSRVYLIMEFVPYPDLSAISIENQEELKKIVYQLLQTVRYIHLKNICHRDIKPDNILYDQEQGQIKLIDFGVSKLVEERGRKREMLTVTGTPYYRAPQMFEGGGYDEKVDIWAIGVTIFKLMTGYTPFESEYHNETINNITKGQVTFPQKTLFPCSQASKNLVKRLLKNKRQDRLTADQALKDLWFISLKETNGLTCSMVMDKSIEKREPTFNPKKSVDLGLQRGNHVIRTDKTMQCFKAFTKIKQQKQIFGFQDTMDQDL